LTHCAFSLPAESEKPQAVKSSILDFPTPLLHTAHLRKAWKKTFYNEKTSAVFSNSFPSRWEKN
jgi:hypothetical protein